MRNSGPVRKKDSPVDDEGFVYINALKNKKKKQWREENKVYNVGDFFLALKNPPKNPRAITFLFFLWKAKKTIRKIEKKNFKAFFFSFFKFYHFCRPVFVPCSYLMLNKTSVRTSTIPGQSKYYDQPNNKCPSNPHGAPTTYHIITLTLFPFSSHPSLIFLIFQIGRAHV